MTAPSKASDNDPELSKEVFTECPIEELDSRCDVITAASVVTSPFKGADPVLYCASPWINR
jgi:hypothetical protein